MSIGFYINFYERFSIALSPVLSVGVNYYIENLVADHHSLFLRLYPEEHLTPKFHFLTHYGEAIRRCGPLRSLWCMRFESKHQLAKRVGDLSNNFRNIALTVATQYTVSAFSAWELNEIWPQTEVGNNLKNFKISWLRFRGVLFRPSCVILHGEKENDLPQLAQVSTISCINSRFTFHCNKLQVESYNEHFCAFVVKKTLIEIDINISQLQCTQPLTLYSCAGLFVVFLQYKFSTAFNRTPLY